MAGIASVFAWRGFLVPILTIGVLMTIISCLPLMSITSQSFKEIKPFIDPLPSNLVLGLMGLFIIWLVLVIILLIAGHFSPLVGSVSAVIRGILYFVIAFYHMALFAYIANYSSKQMSKIRQNWYVASLSSDRKAIEERGECCGFGQGSVSDEVRFKDCGFAQAIETTDYCDGLYKPVLDRAQKVFLGCSITTFLVLICLLAFVCICQVRPAPGLRPSGHARV